jgi:hypothetical protein
MTRGGTDVRLSHYLTAWQLSDRLSLLLKLCVLVAACTPAAATPAEARLAKGAHFVSAASQRSALCGIRGHEDLCEDFRTAPVAEVVRFEQQFPAILRARGFSREAELLKRYERFYWAVVRRDRLYIRGTLVCRERLTDDGLVLLIPTCPVIEITFPAGHPQRVDFLFS